MYAFMLVAYVSTVFLPARKNLKVLKEVNS